MRTIAIILIALTIAAAPNAAAARSETKAYDVAFQNLQGSVADPVPTGIFADGTVDYGGVRFTPLVGETSVTVSVADATGASGQAITVCQDADVDMICGEPGEPRTTGCGSASLAIAPSGGDVLVFVSVQNAVGASIGQQSVTPTPCGDALAAGTTGTVTATFA